MERIRLSFVEQMRILLPYAYHNIKEQFVIVAPVCLYIILFQFIILQYSLSLVSWLTGGILMVMLGLTFFLEGIKIGLVPIGEIVGNSLPKKSSTFVILIFALLLGILGAMGEPVIGSLQLAGSQLKEEHAPLLYKLLVGEPQYLILTVASGVGVATLIGTLRFLYGWSLKPIVIPLVLACVILTIFASRDHLLASAIGLAWDTGAVIVGPVLCPLVLALGLGVCRATGKGDPSMAGFGMVGLIAVVPIAFVVILTFGLSFAAGDHKAGGHGKPTHSVEAPTPVDKAKIEAEARTITLPAELDFAAYYPKLRTLLLPPRLEYAQHADRIAKLPADKQKVFAQAYEINAAEQVIVRKSGFDPMVRTQLPGLLKEIGYGSEENPLSVFKKAYDIEIKDEKNLKGSIKLRSSIPDEVKVALPPILTSIGWADKQPIMVESFILALRAILPIFLFLFVVMRLLKEKGPPAAQLVLALVFVILGLFLFNFGLSMGLGILGNQLGDRLPASFLSYLPLYPEEPSLYPSEIGKVIVVLFALILGYGATLAEPAFNVLGQQVEDVTQGAFKKNLFSQAVALGVGVGAGLGIVSLLYKIDLIYLMLPPYALLVVLSIFNQEKFVNIAWDGGAVTTGPVTVPLKLAIGLSLSSATGAGEGFGVLALASAYPVLNILLLGLFLGTKTPKAVLKQAA